jgi:NodT family efflux transporter outer membrane factor (OMF) lipoprotein
LAASLVDALNAKLAQARLSTLLLPLLWLSACTIGPVYQRPEIQLPEHFSEAGSEWRTAKPGEFKVPEHWWSVFGDADLNRMEAQVLIDNQNLKIAEAQYRAARAALDSANAAQAPTVNGGANVDRGAQKGITSTNYAVSVSANWEIDLWGRIRLGIEAAQANAAASANDLASAQLSTQALLAQTWFELHAAELQIQLLQRTLTADERFLQLTQDRHDAGVASGLDVSQAEAQLNSDRVQLSEIELQHAQLTHAIVTLLGGKSFQPPAAASLPNAPAAPALWPSTWLEQRPDIASAERQAAAANAQIGLAEVAYYPALDLVGSAGVSAGTLDALVNLPSRVWLLGPSLAMTLFDGGARNAAVEQARAGYDQAVANYRQTVLNAFQEVQDNLAASRLLQREAAEQAASLAAARTARDIAEAQYRAGTVNALNVIITQNAVLNAERNAVQIQSRQLAASVQLLKNAGGRTSPVQP